MSNKEISIQYAYDVITDFIPACQYVKNAASRFLKDLENPLYFYDTEEADEVIDFINSLYLTEQVKQKHFYLEPWQTFIVCNLYGLYNVETQNRKYRYAYIELARKSGKSQLANALALYHLIFNTDAQVVISANSKDQAKNIDFKKCKQFAAQLDRKQKHIRHYYNSLKFNDGELIVTASEASKLDGLNTSFAVIDELHEAPSNLMYNVIKSSMGSRRMPMFVVITTAGFDSTSFCYQLRTYCGDILSGIAKDESQFAIIYTLDEGDDYTNKDCWLKSNPNLNISVYSEFIESEVNKAQNFEAEKNGVLVKNFNLWLKANSEDIWIAENYVVKAMQDIKIRDEQFKGMDCWVGVDLSSVSDLTAVSYLIPVENKYYFFIDYYIPQDSINSNINKDMFRNAASNKHLTISSGNVVDYDRILEDILKVNFANAVQLVSYDKWNSTQFAINATAAGLNLQPYSQTAGSLNKPIKEFQKLMLSTGITLQKNILTKWCIANVIIKQNIMGNLSIDKSSRKNKIDGVAASLNVLGSYLESPRYSFGVY
jgi:phage terminase large subunit-like protein